MIGRDDHCLDREEMILTSLSNDGPWRIDVLRQQSQTSLRQVDGEE
jgi:hypothetical protein